MESFSHGCNNCTNKILCTIDTVPYHLGAITAPIQKQKWYKQCYMQKGMKWCRWCYMQKSMSELELQNIHYILKSIAVYSLGALVALIDLFEQQDWSNSKFCYYRVYFFKMRSVVAEFWYQLIFLKYLYKVSHFP